MMGNSFATITTHLDTVYRRSHLKTFVGRQWLVEEIERFRDSQDGRHLIIVGEPGAGKTTILAYLAERWNCLRHFIRTDHVAGVTGLDARSFLLSLATQLRQKYGPEIFDQANTGTTHVRARLIKDKAEVVGRVIDELITLPFLPPPKRDVIVQVDAALGQSKVVGEQVKRLVNVAQALDPLTLLHIALLQPLQNIAQLYPEERVVILVDALDEAYHHPGLKIPDILPRVEDPDFPPNLRLVMTSRRGNHLIDFRQQDLLYLDDTDKSRWQDSLQDVRDYSAARLQEPALKQVIADWSEAEVEGYITNVSQKSDGNFLYLYHLFNELEAVIADGETNLKKLGVLEGLDEIYRHFAVARIRQNVKDSLRFTVYDIIDPKLIVAWQQIEGIEQITINDRLVTIVADDSDKIILKLLRLAFKAGIEIDDNDLIIEKGSGLGNWEQKYIPLLGVFAVSFEALTREQLANFAGVQLPFVDTIVRHLQQFLRTVDGETGKRYRLFHSSFADYLLDSQRNHDYPLNAAEYHSRIADSYRHPAKSWAEVDWRMLDDPYLYNYLPAHLASAGKVQEDMLHQLLLNFDWLQAKLEATNVNSLMADYDLTGLMDIQHPLRLLQDAIRLSSHVIAEDKNQLADQLLGRLLAVPEQGLSELVVHAKKWQGAGARLRPLASCLTPPSSALVRTFTGHTDMVTGIAVTSDGKLALSASQDGTVRVWKIATGEVVTTFSGHSDYVYSVAVTPDGKMALSASEDGTVQVWKIATGEVVTTFSDHSDCLKAALSPDHKFLLITSEDRISVHEETTGEVIGIFSNHSDSVGAMLTPDGEYAIAASENGTMKVWEVATGEILITFPSPTAIVTDVTVTPDGMLALSVVGGKVKVWKIATGELVATFSGHMEWVSSVTVTPDGKLALSASTDNKVQVWQIATRRVIGIFSRHEDSVNAVAVTPDSKLALSASSDGTVQVWELETGEVVTTFFGHSDSVLSVAVTPDGKLAISTSESAIIEVWEIITGKVVTTFDGHHTDRVTGITVTPDGKLALTGSYRRVQVWDLTIKQTITERQMWEEGFSGFRITSITDLREQEKAKEVAKQSMAVFSDHLNTANDIAVTPDSRLALIALHNGKVLVWKIATGEVITTFSDHIGSVLKIAVTPDGKLAFSIDEFGRVKVWEITTGQVVTAFSGLVRTIITVTSNSKLMLYPSEDETVKIREIVTGQVVSTFSGHLAKVMWIAVTPDGKLALSATADGSVKVWEIATGHVVTAFSDLATDGITLTPNGKLILYPSEDETVIKVRKTITGKLVTTFSNHAAPVLWIAVTPDSKLALSATEGGSVKVWEIATGLVVTTFSEHTGWVHVVRTTPDGKLALSASEDKTLKVWEVATGKVVTTFYGEDIIDSCSINSDGKTIIAQDMSGRFYLLALELAKPSFSASI